MIRSMQDPPEASDTPIKAVLKKGKAYATIVEISYG